MKNKTLWKASLVGLSLLSSLVQAEQTRPNIVLTLTRISRARHVPAY